MAKIYYIRKESDSETTMTKNNIKDFILKIYDVETLKFIFGFLSVAVLSALIIFSTYGLLRPKSGEYRRNQTYKGSLH